MGDMGGLSVFSRYWWTAFTYDVQSYYDIRGTVEIYLLSHVRNAIDPVLVLRNFSISDFLPQRIKRLSHI